MDNENKKNSDSFNEESKGKKVFRTIIIIIAILMIIFGAVYFGYYLYGQYIAQQAEEELFSIAQTTVSVDEGVKNPIDFKSLKAKNNEIYAWIKVPGTKVDYPICQSESDDNFYLKHGAMDKKWLSSGAVYTESVNSLDFTDRVTVVYGHNGYGDTMFTTLHKFEKEDFFKEHSEFYIYTTESKLTYKIISAFKYDNRHIMNSFDFQDDIIYSDFIDTIKNPESSYKNIRNDIDKEITIDDNIVVLSTCITNQEESRYLVCGVLVKNEKTY